MSDPPGPRQKKKPRLGDFLVSRGAITADQLKTALAEQRRWGGRIGRTLIELNFLDEPALTDALSQLHGFPKFDFAEEGDDSVTAEALLVLDVRQCEDHDCIPIGVDHDGKALSVAMSEPMNAGTIADIARGAGFRLQPYIAGPRDVARAIRRYYYGEGETTVATLKRGAPPRAASEKNWSFAAKRSATEDVPVSPATPVATSPVAASEIENDIRKQLVALTTLTNLLIEKGVISKEELLDRIRKAKD